MKNLSYEELLSLLDNVFALKKEKGLVIFVDLPNRTVRDDSAWKDRRAIAIEWYNMLKEHQTSLVFNKVYLACYENVTSNNNDLPSTVSLIDSPSLDVRLGEGAPTSLDQLLSSTSVVLAPTQLSATAPLKLLAKKYQFRGATLPGFTRQMIPTLALDYDAITRRVLEFKKRMDLAIQIQIRLRAGDSIFASKFDLRFRTAHASGGLMREPGIVGNLPSGEAYIVPYEGEIPSEKSLSNGVLPVQFENEIVLYKIVENRAVEILSTGKKSEAEAGKLREEPAYGNIAEIGIGVLGEWGIQAMGNTLVDEKLGLHIAFGRSDHFGGATGQAAFRKQQNVVHIDRVYVPSVQPQVEVEEVCFVYENGSEETIIRKGAYTV